MVSNIQLLEEKADSLATAYQALADASNLAAKATAEFLALAKESQLPTKRQAGGRGGAVKKQQHAAEDTTLAHAGGRDDDDDEAAAAGAVAAVLHQDVHTPINSSQNGTTTAGSPGAETDKKPAALKAAAKPKKIRDPDAPRRPKTIFFAFASEARKILKEELAKQHAAAGQTEAETGFNFTDNASLSKEIAERWRSLTDAEKEPWKKMYAEQVKQYEIEKKEYEAKKKALEHPEIAAAPSQEPPVVSPLIPAPSSPPTSANVKAPPVTKKVEPHPSAAVMPEHVPILPPLSSSQIEPPAPPTSSQPAQPQPETISTTPSKKKRKHRKSGPEDKGQQQQQESAAPAEKSEKKKKKKRKSESGSKKDEKSS